MINTWEYRNYNSVWYQLLFVFRHPICFIKEFEDNMSKKSFQVGRRFTSDIQFENRMYVNPMPDQLSERMRRKGEIMIWDVL